MVLQLVLPSRSSDPPPSNRESTCSSIDIATMTTDGGGVTGDESSAVVPVSRPTPVIPNLRVKSGDGSAPEAVANGGDGGKVHVVHVQPALPTSDEDKRIVFRQRLTTLLSCIYAILVVMLGGVTYVADAIRPASHYAELFTIYLTVVGLSYLAFLQFDILRFLSLLKRWRKHEKRKSCAKENEAFEKNGDEAAASKERDCEAAISPPALDAYCFKTGPHSGSFYLKIGAAVFCFGHLIHEGLLLSRQILYFTSGEAYREQCADLVGIVLQTLHPIFSFYQLFIVFKYSNIVINRNHEVARFAMMHIIAANLCLWVNTIIRETVDSLQHETHGAPNNHTTTFAGWSGNGTWQSSSSGSVLPDLCSSKTILSSFTIQASPYLYPFTIEYSLLLVGIWFIIWYNVGNTDGIELQEQVIDDAVEPYSNHLVVHVDCHSANRGLFAGLFILLATVVSVIVFFVAMTNPEYTRTGIVINNVSDTVLLVIMILSVVLAYRQTALLDINQSADPFLDDFLLFIALPCFFLYAIFNVVAGIAVNTPFNVITSILGVIQVVIQTPFVIDGLRRCSNSYLLRYRKPGRELITFLVVCNLACWILETFEIKSHETHSDKAEYYGGFMWTLLSHVTLPLTLFYRFHSSVCLVDVWKSAYEPGDVH